MSKVLLGLIVFTLLLMVCSSSCSNLTNSNYVDTSKQVLIDDGNFAISWSSMDDYQGNIRISLVLTKLSPSGKGSADQLISLTLVDDQGESYIHPRTTIWDTRNGWYADLTRHGMAFSGISITRLPKYFSWISRSITNAPSLALGHITKVIINGKEAKQVNYIPATVSSLENITHLGESIRSDDFITTTVNAVDRNLTFYVNVSNTSYSERIVYLDVGYQTLNGLVMTGVSLADKAGFAQVTVPGGSSKLVPVSFENYKINYKGEPILLYLIDIGVTESIYKESHNTFREILPN